jgi:hypothetical protein
MQFKEWKEFVTYPGDPTHVKSREQRLDTSKGFRVGADGSYPPEMSQCPAAQRAAVIPLSMIVLEGDEFECMEVSDYGHVFIWTQEKVWFITREGNDWQIEKLRYVPRHPPRSGGG